MTPASVLRQLTTAFRLLSTLAHAQSASSRRATQRQGGITQSNDTFNDRT